MWIPSGTVPVINPQAVLGNWSLPSGFLNRRSPSVICGEHFLMFEILRFLPQ